MQTVTQARWVAEVRLMHANFPAFTPTAADGQIGFTGLLAGRSGRTYRVDLRAPVSGYPAKAPLIFIEPRVGPNWYANGALCVARPWRPQQDTFAQQVLYAATYLGQHG